MPPHVPAPPGGRALLTGLAGSVVAACTTPAPANTQASLPDTWPGAEWESITPEQAGWGV